MMIYIYVIFTIFFLFIVVLLSSGIYFYHHSIRRNRKNFIEHDSALQDIYKNIKIQKEWLNGQNVLEESIQSFDHLTLKAKTLKSTIETKRWVIFVHGYTSRGDDMAGFAHLFHEKYKFNVLMPDLRGHGKSEGSYIGFGWHDRIDLMDWIEFLINKYGEDIDIVLFGISMGGATVLMASGEPLPNNVKCLISDCAYDSIERILAYQMKRMYKLPKFPLLNVTSLICKLKAKYYFKDGEVYLKVQKSKTPTLFIHGDSDTFVPTEMVYTLFESAACEKELVIVQGAGHGEAYDTNPVLYENSLETFLEKFIV